MPFGVVPVAPDKVELVNDKVEVVLTTSWPTGAPLEVWVRSGMLSSCRLRSTWSDGSINATPGMVYAVRGTVMSVCDSARLSA